MVIISSAAMKALKAGKKYILEVSLGDNLAAHVQLKPKNDIIQVQAYLMTLDPRARVLEATKVTRTCKSLNTLEVDVRDICLTLLTKIHVKEKRTTKTYTNREFAERVLNVPGILDPNSYASYVARGWGQSTTEDSVKYFANTIGKVYERFGSDATIDDFITFRDEEIDRIYAAEYSHPCKDGLIIQKRRQDIYNGVIERFSRAAVIQKFLIEKHPEMGWPSTAIPVMPRYRTGGRENIKTITMEQYVVSVVLVVRLCRAGCPYAFASLCEVLNAARIGESCAPLVGEFELRDSYGRYYIDYQIDRNRKRTNVLKNPQSHRYIYYGALMIDMIKTRISQLENAGYTSEKYLEMPFASSLDSPNEFLDKGKVSGVLRRIRALAGCDEAWLEREAERLYIAAEASGNRDDVGVGAHEYRSTLATFWLNGGMDLLTVDALLGHENELNRDEDYASWQAGERIVAEMERAICLGSLAMSHNPANNPIVIDKNINFTLKGNNAYQFYCSEDTYFEVDIETLEGNDEIIIIGDKCVSSTSLVRREIPDSVEDKSTRPILANLPSKEDVEKWIKAAYEIDLSDMIERYGQ